MYIGNSIPAFSCMVPLRGVTVTYDYRRHYNIDWNRSKWNKTSEITV